MDFSKGGLSVLLGQHVKRKERVTGIEPVTFCLGSKRSTADLHPRQVTRLAVF